jgi:hypothetical protein
MSDPVSDVVTGPRFSTEPHGGAGGERIPDGSHPHCQQTPSTLPSERHTTSVAKRLGHRRIGSSKGGRKEREQRAIADDRRTHTARSSAIM